MRTTMEITPDGQTIIALCTPLMQRVHATWQFSQELVFVDSSGNMDRQECWVFLFLMHSPCGALPLGVVITSSESESTLTAAFTLLKGIIDADTFFSLRSEECSAFSVAECSRAAVLLPPAASFVAVVVGHEARTPKRQMSSQPAKTHLDQKRTTRQSTIIRRITDGRLLCRNASVSS